MEGSVQRSSGSWWVLGFPGFARSRSDGLIGPAHAVYFATYEAVKHAMGGNEGLKHEHHPLAAGTVLTFVFVDKLRLLTFS